MWRNKLITIFMLLVSLSSYGQTGNEWIDLTQSYYKLKVIKNGFYRLTQSELQAIGFPISSVPANRIQLFRRGQEVALNVNANGDGTLDYLEFYGQKNDGKSDTPLYEGAGQPHTLYNLFSDTASYFLTYKLGNESGKRMVFSSDKNASGLTPEPYHIAESLQLFVSDYAPGVKFGSGSAFMLSKYDDGEGWTGRFIGKGSFEDYSFSLVDYVSAGIDPILETVIVGGNTLNHNAEVAVGENTSSLSKLANVEFLGWGKTLFSGAVSSGNIGPAGELQVRITAKGYPDLAERLSVNYLSVQYPQMIKLGDSENKVFTLSNPGSKAWLQIPTTNAPGTRIFEITDPYNAVRLATTSFSSRIEAVVPNASSGKKIVAVTTPLTVTEISVVNFPKYNLGNKDYLIVTHAALQNAGDPILAYKNYRESVAGGGYKVQVADIADLYDLYGYGDPTPLAIRRFISDANNQNPIKSVFLIGKGYTPPLNVFRDENITLNIPTYGHPGSDLMYTLGVGTDPRYPGVPIGRLNALTPSDVSSYLDKIKEMEALPFNDLFRKDFLQLSGGINQSEIASFSNNIQGFTNILTKDFIGGRAFNTGKETNDAVEFVDVTDQVNQGVGYITFFGHSSGTVTDIEIGRVSNPEFGFSNKGKYPIFIVNGCQAGEIFGTNTTFGEDWMITPDLGAVGFIAHSSVATSSTLRRWSNLFYGIGFADDVFIEKSVGEVMKEVSKRYLDQYGSSNINLTQVYQMTLQGDPAYRLFGADHPDYHIDDTSLSASAIGAEEILATQDSFRVNIVVKNFGRTVSDSLVVQVDRSYADGSKDSYLKSFLRPLRQDTLAFYISNSPTKSNEGLNLLTVLLDPQNATEELNETNNSATLEVAIFSGNTVHAYPIDHGTLSSPQVKFIWHSSNLLEDERGYELEIDTQADFAGPNRRKFNVSGEVLMTQSFDFTSLSLSDSSTIYWRTRYAETKSEETNEWVNTSFTLISGVPEGWGQYTQEQVETDAITGINYNQSTNQWEFKESITPIDILTYGADKVNTDNLTLKDMKAIVGGVNFFLTSNTLDPTCQFNTFNAIAFDKESGDPYRPIKTTQIDVFNREVCGRLPQRVYQFREVDMLGANSRFKVLVDNMRDGDMLVMFNLGNVSYSNWDAVVENTLNTVGVDIASLSLTDGQPVIFVGRKGDASGSASTVINDGSATPIKEQKIDLQTDISGRFESGEIRSVRVGPARNWNDFSYRVAENANDNIGIDVYGVDKQGNLATLASRSRSENIDFTAVDPILYPQMELSFTFNDNTDQTPAQFDFWQLNYEYPPEGIVLPNGKSLSSIQEGEEIVRDFRFLNISEVDFRDSLSVMATLVNQNTGKNYTSSFKIPPALAGDTTDFSVRFSSFSKAGLNSMIVQVMPNENEAFALNNRITLTNLIDVKSDQANPVLDVTFDGYHILDGDVVSSKPTIVVRMRDDNKFIQKSDTVGINLSFKLPGDNSQFQRISFSDPRLEYTPASENQDFQIEYQPGQLSDGMHALRVQAQDESGNKAGTEPYEINFEVINESTITHFYPYPNPFSTQCRFVFTLTGSDIPDEIKIQIMTVSGRVVREITQDEIGGIRIGNNITSYAWDGRDEYGDQLANGVYFYKVFINNQGNEITHRSTNADRAFKHGFGKLYILR